MNAQTSPSNVLTHLALVVSQGTQMTVRVSPIINAELFPHAEKVTLSMMRHASAKLKTQSLLMDLKFRARPSSATRSAMVADI